VASWSELEREAPELAAGGRAALYRSGQGEGLLATVSGDGLPRIHPVNVGIVDGRLLVFVQEWSAKTKDLQADGRYALHAVQDPAEPHEFAVRGRARLVEDPDVRSRAIGEWPFTPRPDYPLFELDIAHALLGSRASPDDWPPKYVSWRSRN
jgi:Pyridoxamine 5'-phosphate oxidase